MSNRAQSGFSLVELAIVLVILGLLVGGIMTGQNLIRAAELRSVTTDIKQYQTAVLIFQDEYLALPGDIGNATAYWGEDSTSCPSGFGSVGTCNGNGDGMIGDHEDAHFFEHLSMAELIEGGYTRKTDGNPYPKKLNSNLYARYHANHTAKNDTDIIPVNANAFYFDFMDIPFLEEEFWNIDMKTDDGKAYTGMVRMLLNNGSGSGCLTASGEYDVTNSGDYNECYPAFLFH